MKLLNWIHEKYVRGRRTQVLSDIIARTLPPSSKVLDVGAGNGEMAHSILQIRSDVEIKGIDVLLYGSPPIVIEKFDGKTIPFPDKSFDVIMFIDVLHHTVDPLFLLQEAIRASRRFILIKDHLLEGLLADETLRFMDWVGNARHNVALPYNFWPEKKWGEIQKELHMIPYSWKKDLHIYPWPATLIFDRSLHFMALFDVK